MAVAPAKYRGAQAAPAPDLSHFRRHYPLTVANFGALADREAWLRRVWEADSRWRAASEEAAPREVVVRGAPPSGLDAEGAFEVIYAGGALATLHASLMACCHGRRVAVLVAPEREGRGRERSVSDEDLREFERAGLLTGEEIETAVVNRHRAAYVKFHDAGSRVKAPPLWVSGVSDVSIDAARLAALASAKLGGRAGCAVVEGARFVRAYVERDRVSVEAETAGGARRLFAARLFVDASGADSEVARQLNGGRAATHVRPAVGTVASGFARGEGAADRVDFRVGEILVSTEDASAHRQLMWEGFGRDARRDEYATRLFFYDSVASPADKSLLALFEQYFEKLPRYKRAGARWRVVRPLFGHAAGSRPAGWKSRRAAPAADRVLLAGGAGGGANPLAASGFGAQLRDLRGTAHLVELALGADLLDARSLSEIGARAPRAAQAAGLAEFLRPAPQGDPANVNETLNAVMAALHDLDERVRRELFQDSLSFAALKSLLGRTLQLYPRLLQRVREHLGARGTLWWLAHAGEAAFAERRARRAERDGGGHEGHAGEPAREFARHLALYKNARGARGRNS